MMGFLDAESFLNNLRNGTAELTEKIYYLSVDREKTSNNDLAELKSRCIRLGYSFNSVEIKHATLYTKTSPLFFYLVRTIPAYSPRKLPRDILFEEQSIG